EVSAGSFTDQYSPVTEMLWYPFFHLGFGPGYMLAVQILSLVLGAYLVLRNFASPWIASIAATLLLAFPPVLSTVVQIGRDAWFTSCVLLMFGAVFSVAKTDGRVRQGWIAAAVLLAWLALTTRQNAAPVVLVGTVLLAWEIIPQALLTR